MVWGEWGLIHPGTSERVASGNSLSGERGFLFFNMIRIIIE